MKNKKNYSALRHGFSLNIEFNRPSRLIKVDRPPQLASEHVIAMLCQRFKRYEWADFSSDKRSVYVLLQSLNDAIAAVKMWQAHNDIPGWKLEIEFARVCLVWSLCMCGCY